MMKEEREGTLSTGLSLDIARLVKLLPWDDLGLLGVAVNRCPGEVCNMIIAEMAARRNIELENGGPK